MIIDNIDGLTKGSHTKVLVKCDFQLSNNCKGEYYRTYKDIIRYRKNGKDTCLQCSRRLLNSGRNNPNCQYALDDNLCQ